MNMTEIKEKARGLGLVPGKKKKQELIHLIQRREGNFPCFETAKDYCDQKLCCWRDACLPKKKKKILFPWQKKEKSYAEKLADKLDGVKKELAELEVKVRQKAGKAKKEAEGELKDLDKKWQALKKKSQKKAAKSEEAWKIAKKGLDDAWKDLSKAMGKAAKKMK